MSSFAPLALWTATCFGLLMLAHVGPKLWATQPGENATIAIDVMAVGQLLFAAIAWPIWTRALAAALGTILTSPAWLILAARIRQTSSQELTPRIAEAAAAIATLAVIRALVPRGATGFIWSLILAAAVGGPMLWFLARGG